MQPCPPPERWQAFLTEQLDAASAAVLAEHLEGCAACRQVLDGLGADSDSKTLRLAREPRPDGDHEPPTGFLRRLEDLLQTTSAEPSLSPAAAPLPQPQRYEVQGELGRGGMGI